MNGPKTREQIQEEQHEEFIKRIQQITDYIRSQKNSEIFYVSTDISLCANYEAYSRFNGWKDWNTACKLDKDFANYTKTYIKEEYKRLKGTTTNQGEKK